MKVVAFATIRLNSKRLHKKNLLPIAGKPMCYHILQTALDTHIFNDIYVYCSDPSIINAIPEKTVFLKRDKRLDEDTIKAQDTYSAFIKDVPDADVYVALCTTSPFTKKESIIEAVAKVVSGEYDSAFCATKAQSFGWYMGKPINYDPSDIPRTQDLEPIYIETSGFFVFTRELWLNYKRRIGFNPYIQCVDSIEGIDIDTLDDYNLAVRLS